MIDSKPTQEDMIIYEIISNPVLFTEFVYNYGLDEEVDTQLELTWYQKEFMLDFSNYISIVAGRSSGKTFSMTWLIIWCLVYNIFPMNYIVYLVPNKVQLDPVWSGLTKAFRSNPFLKNFISQGSGINNSMFTIKLLNDAELFCRLAGNSGTGQNVIGVHTPLFIVDECMVAGTKISTPTGTKQIQEFKPGDKIVSWNGFYTEEDRVISVQKTEVNQSILEIGFNGTFVRVGENHRVYNGTEYIEAKYLNTGDRVYMHTPTRCGMFSKNEICIIRDLVYNGKNTAQIAKELNRTELSIDRYINRNFGGIKNLRDSFSLTDEESQVILGSLLGDGSAEIEPFRARYRTNHSIKQKEYVDWIRRKLHRLVRVNPRISVNGGWGTYNYSLSTIGHKDILAIANKLYINNKKTITREYLDKLSPLGLAAWFMDGGSANATISTHSFSKEENEIISQYFKEVWNLDSRVICDTRRNLYYIKFEAKSFYEFINIIEDFVIDSMKYKIRKKIHISTEPKIEIIEKCEHNDSLQECTIDYIRVVNTRAKHIYNIEVENNHNYFANGVLCKNSGYQPWGTWIELQPTVNTFTNGFRLIVAGVPDGRREKSVCFHCDQENSNYSKHHVSSDENPRLTDEDRRKAIEDYGGEDSEDYIHLWKAEHGKPVFALFDRNNFSIGTDPVYSVSLMGIGTNDLGEHITKLALIPKIEEVKGRKVIFGIDLGYTEPTAIYICYIQNGNIHFHAKIRMEKVAYPVQTRIIDYLAGRFNPILIGVDKGSAGIAVIQTLQQSMEYASRNYESIVLAIDFSGSITLGIDSDGKEIKSRTKPFAVNVLQEYTNNHKIIYSSTDLETITELERMTYLKSADGTISYRTLTGNGGKKGEDHFTSALLCLCMAYYVKNDFIQANQHTKRLARVSWF